jgi:hypothetical protein
MPTKQTNTETDRNPNNPSPSQLATPEEIEQMQNTIELVKNITVASGIDWDSLSMDKKQDAAKAIVSNLIEYMESCMIAEDEQTQAQLRMIIKSNFNTKLVDNFQLQKRLEIYFTNWIQAYTEHLQKDLVK